MKKALFLILVFISIVALVIRFGTKPLGVVLNNQQKAGVKITAAPQASVFINGQEVGQTPYQVEDLSGDTHNIKLIAGKSVWEDQVKLTKGTLTVINRELAENIASQSGEVLSLTPGRGIVITSTPSEAVLTVDGKEVGKTPISLSELPAGEHTFLLSRPNYLKRNIKANVPDNLTLNLAVDLAISEADLTSTATAPVVASSSEVTVKATPTGFLRVRDKPNLSGVEIGRVTPGEKLTLLDDPGGGWLKVRLSDNKEGYVSAAYIQK